MTDLEMVRKCAERMGFAWSESWAQIIEVAENTDKMIAHPILYNPLIDDKQAMALVKKFDLKLQKVSEHQCRTWMVNDDLETSHFDLNRAICECVANLPEES